MDTLRSPFFSYKLSSILEMFLTLSALMKFEMLPSITECEAPLLIVKFILAVVEFNTTHCDTVIDYTEQEGVPEVLKDTPTGKLMMR